ncbi:hypothetical protein COLO4_07486 [Corchorus olitorius]|uniref:Uncharacterized protein n=1 Tax=Corchorus olitorius TaxID=93759 RepID=A0A1R3KJK5_9ROSI|nr:hypothetical protein COLO4_07486 [Corchorus olitorius]
MNVKEDSSVSQKNKLKTAERHKNIPSRDVMPGSDLWTDGLICAFEFIRGHKRPVNSKYGSRVQSKKSDNEYMKVQTPANGQTEAFTTRLDAQKVNEPSSSYESRERENVAISFEEYRDGQSLQLGQFPAMERYDGSCWVPIGWERISELVKNVQVNGGWASQQFDLMDNEEDFTVADLAAPYWERPAGPIWWCHLAAGNPTAVSWLSNAQWLHPAVSLALRDESRLISERMKHLLYEVMLHLNLPFCR